MEIFNWSSLLADAAPQTWLDTRGKNVKVALIDTGVGLGVRSLGHLDRVGRKFFVGKTGFSVMDHIGKDPVGDGFSGGGHGTQLACILAGKSDTVAQPQHLIDGIANQADVFVIKARDNSGAVTEIKHLLHSIELAAELGVEIAVTAQGLSKNRIDLEGIPHSEVERVMNKAKDANLILFAATENRGIGNPWDNVVGRKFPNNQDVVINVAAAPVDMNAVRSQISSQKIHFLLGGFKGMAYDTNSGLFHRDLNNSTAVAIMGGIAALCLSSMKEAGASSVSREELLAELATHCRQLSAANGSYPTPVIFKNF